MLRAGAVQRCVAEILAKAKEFREAFGAEPQARSLEWAAMQVEQALRDDSDQLPTLTQAAEISGYHPDSLARMVRDKQIPDLRSTTSKGPIRIRRGDLPIKPGRHHTPDADSGEAASVRSQSPSSPHAGGPRAFTVGLALLRPRFKPLSLEPLEQILDQVPLRFSSEIEARYAKPLHLPRLYLEPTSDLVAGPNSVDRLAACAPPQTGSFARRGGTEGRQVLSIIEFGQSSGVGPPR